MSVIENFKTFFLGNDSFGVEFNPPASKKEIKKFGSDYDWEFPNDVRGILVGKLNQS